MRRIWPAFTSSALPVSGSKAISGRQADLRKAALRTKGNVISAKTLDLYDGSLWGANYLIEGVIGSIT